MTITYLTNLLYHLNHALDTGRYDSITLDEIEEQAEIKQVLPYLKSKLGRDLDISLFSEADLKEVSRCYKTAMHVIDPRRKMGVENRGLCLVIGWTIVLIQQQLGDIKADFSDWGGD